MVLGFRSCGLVGVTRPWAPPERPRAAPAGRLVLACSRRGRVTFRPAAAPREATSSHFCIADWHVAHLRLHHGLEALEALLPQFLGQPADLLGILGLADAESVLDGPDPCLVLGVERLAMLGQQLGDGLGPLLLRRNCSRKAAPGIAEPGGGHPRQREAERLCPEHLGPLERPVSQHVLLHLHGRLGGLAVVLQDHVKHRSPPRGW